MLLQSAAKNCYKVRQTLLQSAAKFVTKCGSCYKVRQLLQSGAQQLNRGDATGTAGTAVAVPNFRRISSVLDEFSYFVGKTYNLVGSQRMLLISSQLSFPFMYQFLLTVKRESFYVYDIPIDIQT